MLDRMRFFRAALAAIAAAAAVPASADAVKSIEIEPARQLVHDWVAAFNARKFDMLRALLAPHYVNHNPNVPSGADATIKFLEGVAASLPEAHLNLEDTIIEGSKIAARMTLSSKTDGTLNKGTVIDIWRVENGRLAEHWDTAS